MSKKSGQARFIEAFKSSWRALVLIGASFILVLFYRHGRDNVSPEDAFSLNVHTEVIGVGISVLITVFVIDELNRRRDKERRAEERKNELLRNAESPVQFIGQAAFFELRRRNLIFGEESLIQKKVFEHVTPVEVDLSNANLSNAVFLLDADFRYSNFSGAKLRNTYLCNALLTKGGSMWCRFHQCRFAGCRLVRSTFGGG